MVAAAWARGVLPPRGAHDWVRARPAPLGAFPARLRPFQALDNTVRGWLLGFTVLFWGILLAIGVRATWPAGAWAVVALYAGLAALSGGVYVCEAAPAVPGGVRSERRRLGSGSWPYTSRSYSPAGGSRSAGPAGRPSRATPGPGCSRSLGRRARGDAGRAWLTVTAVACAWGLLSSIAGLHPRPHARPGAAGGPFSSAIMLALAWVSLATVGTLISFWVARDARAPAGGRVPAPALDGAARGRQPRREPPGVDARRRRPRPAPVAGAPPARLADGASGRRSG